MKKIIENKINGKTYEICMLIIVLLFVFVLTIQSVQSIEIKYGRLLDFFDYIITAIFFLDYILRIYISENRIKYIFSFNGLVDLISILPTLIPKTILDLRAIRVVRSIRIFRLFKLTRYTRATEMLSRVFKKEKEVLLITFVIAISLIYISAVLIYGFENADQPEVFRDIPTSLWWAVATMTTVGYGDMYPITSAGKIIASMLIFVGIGIIAIPSGVISAGFLYELQEERKDSNLRD